MLASSKLLWFRLHQGKVWHVAASGATVALCGQTVPVRGERQPKRPPYGGRPCPDCSSVSAQIEHNVAKAEDAVAEQRRTPAPAAEADPDPYEHTLTEGRVEAISLDPTNENPFPGAGEVTVVGVDEFGEQVVEELDKLVAEGVVEYGVFGEVAPSEYEEAFVNGADTTEPALHMPTEYLGDGTKPEHWQ